MRVPLSCGLLLKGANRLAAGVKVALAAGVYVAVNAPLSPRLLAALAWMWLAAALPFLTDAACDFPAMLVLGGSWLVLYADWVVMPRTSAKFKRSWSGKLWWLSAAAAGALGFLLAVTPIGLITRVALCERSLANYATKVPPDGGEFLHDSRLVGLFLVDGELRERGVVLLYTSHGFLCRRGVAYVPPGTDPLPRIPRHHLEHLYGPWYWFNWHF
jgi:hypothetical protein